MMKLHTLLYNLDKLIISKAMTVISPFPDETQQICVCLSINLFQARFAKSSGNKKSCKSRGNN